MAQILHDTYGVRFVPTSQCIASTVIFPQLQSVYDYATPLDCYNDRHNHRSEWFDLIDQFNKHDKTRLAKSILQVCDCYVGMRNAAEVDACRRARLFDIVVWVDARERVALEAPSSCTVSASQADYVIHNNGSLLELEQDVQKLAAFIRQTMKQ